MEFPRKIPEDVSCHWSVMWTGQIWKYVNDIGTGSRLPQFISRYYTGSDLKSFVSDLLLISGMWASPSIYDSLLSGPGILASRHHDSLIVFAMWDDH